MRKKDDPLGVLSQMKTFNKKYVSLITTNYIEIIIDFIFVPLLLKHQKSVFVIMSCVERVIVFVYDLLWRDWRGSSQKKTKF